MNKDDLSFKFITFYRFSWLAFALYQPASIGAVYLVLYPQFDTSGTNLLALTIALVASLGVLAVLLLGQQILDRISNELLFKQSVILLLVTAGVMRGLIFFYGAELAGFENPTTLFNRLVNSTTNAVFFLLFWSVGIQKHRSLDARYRAFMVDKVIEETKKYSYQDSKDIKGALESVSLMKRDLKLIVGEAEDIDSGKLLLAANKIDAVIKEEIKPLSKRLYTQSILTPPKSRFLTTLIKSIDEFNYSIRLTAGLILILSFFNWKSIYSLSSTLYSTVVATALYLVPALIHRWIIRKNPEHKLLANRVFLIYLFTHSYNQYLLSRYGGVDYGPHPMISVILLLPFVPGIALLSAWLKQSFADKRQLLFKLGEPQAIEEARNPQTLAAMGISDQRAITSFLHNSVQSELQALLKQLQKAVRFNDPALSREAMEKLTSYVNRSTRDDFELVTTNPEKRYKRLTSAWDGIIAIESSLSADFFTTNAYASIVVEIIEEFVTNAVRHSGATEVFIAGKDESKGFVLTLTRDGQPTKKGTPGIGSKLLETVSYDVSESRLLDNRTQLQIKL